METQPNSPQIDKVHEIYRTLKKFRPQIISSRAN
jgi:hypothetical protein